MVHNEKCVLDVKIIVQEYIVQIILNDVPTYEKQNQVCIIDD